MGSCTVMRWAFYNTRGVAVRGFVPSNIRIRLLGGEHMAADWWVKSGKDYAAWLSLTVHLFVILSIGAIQGACLFVSKTWVLAVL